MWRGEQWPGGAGQWAERNKGEQVQGRWGGSEEAGGTLATVTSLRSLI